MFLLSSVDMLQANFFERDAFTVALSLLGKVIRYRVGDLWLATRIIETEAYYIDDKASHASLGFTTKRRALFMPAGTIYMYYARGGDSLNISCQGNGNAVLIKSGYPFFDERSPQATTLPLLQQNNLLNNRTRTINTLCKGQTLLCKSLGLKVSEWDGKTFDAQRFYIEHQPLISQAITTTRLGIPKGRDEHRMLRCIDEQYARHCTSNPLTKRQPPPYRIINLKQNDKHLHLGVLPHT